MTAVTAALSLLVPAGTPVVTIKAGRTAARGIGAERQGEQLVLLDGRPLSPRRLRRLARDAGLAVDREFTVLPSLGEAAFVVEDAGESLSWWWGAFATVPPGHEGGALLTLAIRLAGRPAVLRWIGHVVPGRLVIAHRP